MAAQQHGYLTEDERGKLRSHGLEDFEIMAREKAINRRLDHRESNWTMESGLAPRHTTQTIRIVMCGLGGVGKSALGNLMTGKNRFKSSLSANAETLFPESETFWYGSQHVQIIDTPGYLIENLLSKIVPFSSQNKANKKLIIKGLDQIEDGVDVLVFVMNLANPRMREKEIKIITDAKILNTNSIKYFMIVGTHAGSCYATKGKDQFLLDARKNATMEDFLKSINHRFVLVELGGDTCDESEIGQSMPSKIEKEQARRMVMSMVGKVTSETTGNYKKENIKQDMERCFPSHAKVCTVNGEKTMEELKLGDRVLVINNHGVAEYEEIIMFSDSIPDQQACFLSITTKNGNILELTPGHFVHVGNIGDLKAAEEIKIGDIIFTYNKKEASSESTSVVNITRKYLTGIYCPHTASGNIVVDGVVTSCYTNILSPTTAHLAMFPVRMLSRILPWNLFTGIFPYNKKQGMPMIVWYLKQVFTALMQ